LFASAPSGARAAAWDMDQYRYRVPLRVGAAGYERRDKPVEVQIDFWNLPGMKVLLSLFSSIEPRAFTLGPMPEAH
jgi:hypothetical protein